MQNDAKHPASLCVWFLQILVAGIALMEVLAIAPQRNYLLGSATAAAVAGPRMPLSTRYKVHEFPYRNYFSDDQRNHRHHHQDAGVRSTLSVQRRSSRDDLTATSRHKLLQQTSGSAEVQVLIAFKEGVASDPLGALNDWNQDDADACHWNGVTCAQRSNSVVALDLGSFQLVGIISPLLGRLANLQILDLSDNSFQGEIPNTLLNCSRLSHLALPNNNLTGQIPAQVGNLLHLQVVDLSNNFLLAGRIPASLSNCSLLEVISLDTTRLSGEIPSSWGQLARLETLNLTNTYTSGTIPKSLGNCTSLMSLWVGSAYDLEYAATINPNNPEDELSGELPRELAKLTRLKELVIEGTNIQGPFPAWLANLTALTTIALALNPFNGEIPQFLGNLPLEHLVLEVGFSGAIPVSISNCTNLSLLGIETNTDVTGAIPPELGMLSKLKTLVLAENSLSGTIPSSLSNCSALTKLQLGQNPLDPQPIPPWVASLVNLTNLFLADMNLQGEIPVALGQLSKLDTLILWGNQFTEPIPASLGNCTFLRDLEFSQNQLSGEVPPEIWMLSQLQFLSIDNNALTGTIPPSLGNLSFLESFDCSFNSFTGGIPSQLGSLQSLEDAFFDSNIFHGSIPQSLGNCSALNIMDLSSNHLSGSIPGSFSNLTTLEELFISENQLEGGIPVDLMRCTALGYLDLSYNLLEGNIPLEIGQLVSLQNLYLNNNKLSGHLPNSLSLLTGLPYLDVSYNALSGAVPGGAIANMSGILNSLNVSHNRLSGSLPTDLEKLTLVFYLDFSANNFSGYIPSGLGNCKSLQRLDLSVNNLSGSIPATLAQLQYLAFVNVSYNQLQGPVPDGGVFNSSNLTAASFLGNPGLCGNLLEPCPVGPSPASPSSCKAFQCGRVRRAVIVACAGVGVVLVTIAAIFLTCWLFYSHGKHDATQSSVMTFPTGLKVSEEELLSIVERPENIIGVGATSTVYKGVLNGGRIVAIKVLRLLIDSDDQEHNQQAAAQLFVEAHTLSQLRHRNILNVLGLFSTHRIKALITEFMPNASLHQHLHEVEECDLSWEARLNIALGVAHGIAYLHSQAHVPVIHRDLKPSNIFLDAQQEPKLGDFGFSRLVNQDGEVTASNFCGTYGYIPPEYGATTRVSTKGDIYSYGVILLELLTRKRPIVHVTSFEESNPGLRGQPLSRHLVDLVLESSKETPLPLLDPMLLISESISASNADENNSGEQMKLLMQVGLLCTQDDPHSRPQMSDVLAMLMQIKNRGLDPPAHSPTVAALADQITGWPTPAVNAVGQSDSN